LRINDEYYYDSDKLEEQLLKSQIQKALEPFKTLLESKKMEVHITNKAKGKTEVIIGTKPTVEKAKIDTTFLLKPVDQYPTDDVFTPRQLQKMALDHQNKTVKKLRKDLERRARRDLPIKTKRKGAQK
jgi:hypothetical protein